MSIISRRAKANKEFGKVWSRIIDKWHWHTSRHNRGERNQGCVVEKAAEAVSVGYWEREGDAKHVKMVA